MKELDFQQESIPIFCDNQSIIYLMKNPIFHECSKHIDIKLHIICDIIGSGVVNILKIDSTLNLVDAMTKPLPKSKFKFYF